MNRWGTETYVYNVIKKLDKEKFDISVLVKDMDLPGEYAEELMALYNVNFYSIGIWPRRKNFFRYQYKLYKFLKIHKFDIVHANATEVNGYYLPASFFANVKVRINHSHNDNSYLKKNRDLLWRLFYEPFLKSLSNKFMSDGIAISKVAGNYLFGNRWQKNCKINYIHCGLDFTPYKKNYSLSRTDFNIDSKDIVLFASGRFYLQKNHEFLIDVIYDLVKCKKIENIKVLLAGDGELKDKMISKVNALGLAKYFNFLGSRNDIPALLKNVADIFLFPSLFEGLGLAFIEAQCAGKVCVVSSEVPSEGDVLSNHIYRLRVDSGVGLWSNVLKDIIDSREFDEVDALQCYSDVMASTFNIDTHLHELLEIYLKGS